MFQNWKKEAPQAGGGEEGAAFPIFLNTTFILESSKTSYLKSYLQP